MSEAGSLLLDSSILIAVERGALPRSALDDAMAERRGCISAITASELLFGVHRAESALRRARREEAVERVLAEATVLPFDLAAARVHARLAVDAAAAGIAIGAHDLIIAATAIAHDAPLLTLNIQEFRRIPGLRVETARAE